MRSERAETMEVLDEMNTTRILPVIVSPIVLATSWDFLFAYITTHGLAFFAPNIIRTIYSNATVVR